MKFSFKAGLLAVAALGLWASTAHAAVEFGDTVRLYGGPGSVGGIFHVDVNPSGPVSYDFDTFCVELNEFITLGTSYTVASVGTTTVSSGKVLTDYVAWLYDSFLDGQLSGFSGSAAHANALQLEIWRSMTYTDTQIKNQAGTSWFNNASATLSGMTWGSDYAASGWTGTGAIQIMNLVGVNNPNSHHQDQLFRLDPPGSGEVPEAGSIAIWGLLGAMAAVAFRFKRSKTIV